MADQQQQLFNLPPTPKPARRTPKRYFCPLCQKHTMQLWGGRVVCTNAACPGQQATPR
jgi:hypothetical protein